MFGLVSFESTSLHAVAYRLLRERRERQRVVFSNISQYFREVSSRGRFEPVLVANRIIQPFSSIVQGNDSYKSLQEEFVGHPKVNPDLPYFSDHNIVYFGAYNCNTKIWKWEAFDVWRSKGEVVNSTL